MLLNEGDSKKFSQWLKDNSVSTKCPSCESKTKWKTGNKFVLINAMGSALHPGGGGNHKDMLPTLYTVCENCGYVRFYSCETIGVLPDFWTLEEAALQEKESLKKQ